MSRSLAVMLVVASLAAANALAGFLTGPELYGPPGAQDTLAARTAFPSPEAEARARAVEKFHRVAVYLAFNIITVSALVFVLAARRMERTRRRRLGLPEGLDESWIDPHAVGPGGRPRAANDFGPSMN